MRTEILYEDRDVLAVYKPAGLATQTARAGQPDVASELKNYLHRSGTPRRGERENIPYLGVVHRLDQPVEGLLVFAKNKKAAADLSGQLRRGTEGVSALRKGMAEARGGQLCEGSFCKRYYAVLCGIPAEREGELIHWIYKDRENRAVVLDGSGEGPDGLKAGKAILRYRILEVREAYGVSLADIRIDTGRFHQIRAQAAHAGMPLLGDRKYGTKETEERALEMGISSVALCAYSLEFVHPADKKEMHFRIKPKNKAFACFSQL